MKAIYYIGSSRTGGLAVPQIKLYADSAISRDTMPLFVPDLLTDWHLGICVAVRVHKLGKNLSPKFVTRYADAIGAVGILKPGTTSDFEYSGVMQILDGAVTTGKWIETDIGALVSLSLDINGIHYEYYADEMEILQIISCISRFATLKTGDMIILGYTEQTIPIKRNDVIDVSLESETLLHVRIK